MNLQIPDSDAMETLGMGIAKRCPSHCVIYLQGTLGTGKTTFARGFLRGLGYTGFVKSPTYTLIESYPLATTSLYHFDLYRLDAQGLDEIGIRDYFDGAGICLVEWPERGAGILIPPDLWLHFSYQATGREVTLCGQSPLGNSVLQAYREALNL